MLYVALGSMAVNLIVLLAIGMTAKKWTTLALVALAWTLADAVIIAMRPELPTTNPLLLTLGFLMKYALNLLLLAAGRGIRVIIRKVRGKPHMGKEHSV